MGDLRIRIARRHNAVIIDDAQYLEMVLKKTCWLATIYPMRAGALVASRGCADLEAFVRFGFFLGTAFQIQDDLLNLCGDARYGKERDGDLWEGKRTLMLIRALRECTAEEGERLHAILCRSRPERNIRNFMSATLLHRPQKYCLRSFAVIRNSRRERVSPFMI